MFGPGLMRRIPWMKVLRKPRLNRTVVSVAVETADNFSLVASSIARSPLPAADPSCPVETRFVNTCQVVSAPLWLPATAPAHVGLPGTRETILRHLLGAIALSLLALATRAEAQDWPQRQVNVVVPFTARHCGPVRASPRPAYAGEFRTPFHRREPRRRRRQYRYD